MASNSGQATYATLRARFRTRTKIGPGPWFGQVARDRSRTLAGPVRPSGAVVREDRPGCGRPTAGWSTAPIAPSAQGLVASRRDGHRTEVAGW
ncbi:hypothetical protein GCM10010964_13580 [Caldovatus sediminis]|uniref:Uncharacterized protein n=1 Tax=Caldovatus sediminis TaxID=2041189 RepID=A0A8J3EBH8_9PROT|nr:hypothetical protein GCM10010964_13580 [Caldovatus sediminis]